MNLLKKLFKNPKPKIIVIVGPTASGKTSLSIKVAQQLNGEIISADSRQVYRELNIGAAKITEKEMMGIPHHLLNVATLDQNYSVYDFVRDAKQAIDEIRERGHLPIIVGGTGFYIDELIYEHRLPDVPQNKKLRTILDTSSTEELLEKLKKLDSTRFSEIDHFNRPRIIRAIEIATALGSVPKRRKNTKWKSVYDPLIIGLQPEREILHKKVSDRIDERMRNGMLEEVQELLTRGVPKERLYQLGLEYRYLSQFASGETNQEEALESLTKATYQFIKRQYTWFKRNPNIYWIDPENKDEVARLLEKINCR